MKNLGDTLTRAGIFSSLSRKEIDTLIDASETIELDRKDILFNPGSTKNSIFLLISGGMKLCKMKGDTNLILEIFRPGDIIGEEALFFPDHGDSQAMPLESASLIKINSKIVAKLLQDNPQFAEAWIELNASRCRAYRTKLENMVFMEVRARLAGALVKLARDFGRRDKQGTLIAVRLTHQDLADYIGASRETVSLTLGQMRKRKLIRMNVRQFIIPDIKALRKLVV